jgi:Ran GTPase-activating protein (RanGAP) involved in mRNA processing and transport
LTAWNTTLAHLSLGGNRSCPSTICSAIAEITDANKVGIRLLHAEEVLDLSSKRISTTQINYIAKELAHNTTVKSLLLSDNYSCDEGSVGIANALAKNRSLMSINLDINRIGKSGSLAIAAVLLENNVLTKLFLNRNRIGPAVAVALAEALRINTSLRQLGLGGNDIGTNGAIAVAGALKSNATLARLTLDDNGIGPTGVGALADALRTNACLQGLQLGRNSIDNESAMAVLEVLKHYNCTLLSLNLAGDAAVSPLVLESVDRVLASRLVLKCFLHQWSRPLEERAIPLVVRAAQQSSVYRSEAESRSGPEMAAGPIFYLVRAAALTDSKVLKSGSAVTCQATVGRRRIID